MDRAKRAPRIKSNAVLVGGKPHPRLRYRGALIRYEGPDPSGSGERVRLTTGYRRGEEAAAALKADEWTKQAASPHYRLSVEKTWGDAVREHMALADAWRDQETRQPLSPHTLKGKSSRCACFTSKWGEDKPLSRIDADTIAAYWQSRLKDEYRPGKLVQPQSITKELIEFKIIWKMALLRKWVSIPLEGLIAPYMNVQAKNHSRSFPAVDEVRAMLAWLPLHRAAHVAYALALSLREDEAQNALRGDVRVNADGSRDVYIHATKTAHARSDAAWLPVHDAASKLLDFALANAPGKEVGKPLFAPWSAWKNFEVACRRLGFGVTYTWNDYRRALPNWLLRAGVIDEMVAAKMLRHTDLDSIKHYIREVAASPEHVRKLQQVGAARALAAGIIAPQILAVPECAGSVQHTGPQNDIPGTQGTPSLAKTRGKSSDPAVSAEPQAIPAWNPAKDAQVVDMKKKSTAAHAASVSEVCSDPDDGVFPLRLQEAPRTKPRPLDVRAAADALASLLEAAAAE